MNCKKCIHYEVCESFLNFNGMTMQGKENRLPVKDGVIPVKKLKCRFEKDKSQIVELPCKVGDIVYTIPRSAIRKWRVVFVGLCEFPYINIAWYKDRNNFETRSIYFEQIGKTVFLTKEEAEAKLKELNEK